MSAVPFHWASGRGPPEVRGVIWAPRFEARELCRREGKTLDCLESLECLECLDVLVVFVFVWNVWIFGSFWIVSCFFVF